MNLQQRIPSENQFGDETLWRWGINYRRLLVSITIVLLFLWTGLNETATTPSSQYMRVFLVHLEIPNPWESLIEFVPDFHLPRTTFSQPVEIVGIGLAAGWILFIYVLNSREINFYQFSTFLMMAILDFI